MKNALPKFQTWWTAEDWTVEVTHAKRDEDLLCDLEKQVTVTMHTVRSSPNVFAFAILSVHRDEQGKRKILMSSLL